MYSFNFYNIAVDSTVKLSDKLHGIKTQYQIQ